jgi:hypothetical protein
MTSMVYAASSLSNHQMLCPSLRPLQPGDAVDVIKNAQREEIVYAYAEVDLWDPL